MEKTRPLRIQLVEDEMFVALDTEATLVEAGHCVVATAVSADQAVQLAGELRPDLILMDIRLADGRDGIEAAEEIKTRFEIPILFATAYNDEATRDRAAKVGPLGILSKPVDPQDLVRAINAAFRMNCFREIWPSGRVPREVP